MFSRRCSVITEMPQERLVVANIHNPVGLLFEKYLKQGPHSEK